MLVIKVCNVFVTAKFEEWRKQLGTYMIDYNNLTFEKAIAKGLRIKMTFYIK